MQAYFVVYRISPLVLWFDVYYLMHTHPHDTLRGGLWITYQISMTCLQKLRQRRCHLSVRPSHRHYRVLMLLLLLVSMVHPVHYYWLVVYRVDQGLRLGILQADLLSPLMIAVRHCFCLLVFVIGEINRKQR